VDFYFFGNVVDIFGFYVIMTSESPRDCYRSVEQTFGKREDFAMKNKMNYLGIGDAAYTGAAHEYVLFTESHQLKNRALWDRFVQVFTTDVDDDHAITIARVEDEHFLTIHHPMTKQHYISFVAFVTSDRFQMVKLYPEGNAQTRLQQQGMGYLYYYCNQHGLFRKKI